MEEFEHMIVEDFNEEDFYETIEAPKFVDLTAPDHRPEGDDRYWFCSRVGCDQKHEEFMDSEAIYKNFVLRVMAARSPNVRLRKALYRKDSTSVDPKCPNTVPAKPSRSRISRLAMISSIPQKATNGIVKSKEAKVISLNATPKTKVKGKESLLVSSVPKKALTERKKQMQSPAAAFRSVQNPRTAAVRASKNRVVAKALVFQSPKKLVKLKRSVELSSSVKKICNGIRKLETENKRNVLGFDHKVGNETSVPSRKPLKGREVKSRVFDSLRSQKQIGDKSNGHGTLKQKVKEKQDLAAKGYQIAENEEKQNELALECKGKENATTAVDVNREDLAVIKENGVDKAKLCETENKENALPLACDDKENATNAADVDREDHAVTKESGVEKAKLDETAEPEDKENALPLECDDKENVARESDDKENSLALDNNRKIEHGTDSSMKKKIFGKKETFKTTQKGMTIADKCFSGKTVSASTRVKYTKPKLTNPKPFRLRTDERQILKEAITEKKPKCDLAKEETASILGCNGENFDPKRQPARVEKNTRGNVSRGTSKKIVRHDNSENMVNCKRVTTKKMASKTIETVEETSPMNGESTEVCVVASGEKRPATVPKGPNFHSIHVPKSCTKRLTSRV
ncbi:hypothetical protein AALP_AA8G290000 [Arabis alpina]|uniref:Uncharacterized protein n=1 Tax=Arabis alpina TaxID=50452 RepID=A0A087GA58_ARAAL|nr:hypothetical protein AALP_AA8G290000 [Arabis alpina]